VPNGEAIVIHPLVLSCGVVPPVVEFFVTQVSTNRGERRVLEEHQARRIADRHHPVSVFPVAAVVPTRPPLSADAFLSPRLDHQEYGMLTPQLTPQLGESHRTILAKGEAVFLRGALDLIRMRPDPMIHA